jgi:hypothetical protein
MFDLILPALSAVKYSPDTMKYFTALKSRVLSDLSSTNQEQTRAAKDFSRSEAVEMFGLKFEDSMIIYNQRHHWPIEKEVEGKEFPTTPCIGETYMPPC